MAYSILDIKSGLNIGSLQNKIICCGYTLEAPHRGASNEYPQNMFLRRNRKKNVKIFLSNKRLIKSHVQELFILHRYLNFMIHKNTLRKILQNRLYIDQFANACNLFRPLCSSTYLRIRLALYSNNEELDQTTGMCQLNRISLPADAQKGPFLAIR